MAAGGVGATAAASRAIGLHSAMYIVPFCVLGMTGYYPALQSIPPTSYRGAADVAVIMANFARQMGRNRALARHPLNGRLFAAEMLAAMPSNEPGAS